MNRPRKSWFTAAFALAALTMVVSACGSGKPAANANASGSSSGAASGSGSGSSAHLTTVKVGMIPAGADGGFIDMAQEQGYYKECGIDLKVDQVPNGTQLAPAIVSGAVDVAIEGPQEMLVGVSKGELHAKVIGAAEPGLPWAIYGGKGITSLKDLAGKTVASSSATSLNTVVASLILKKHGINPSSVKFVNSGTNADKFKAVVTGVTAGASAPSNFIPEAKKDGIHVLATAAKDLPQYPRWTIIARDDFLAAHPQAATCYLAATMRGERYAFSHPDAAKALAAKDVGGSTKPDSPIVTNEYQQIVQDKLVNRNAQVPTADIEFEEQTLVSLGLLKSTLPLAEVYTDKYRQAALKMVGGPQ